MNWQPAKRIQSVQTPVIPLVGEWIAQHPGTISLGQGIVHYPPPPSVSQAVAEAAAQASTNKYCLVAGIPTFLAAARAKLESENQLNFEGSAVLATAGSNMGFLNAVIAIADPGDEIILLAPYYFNHEMAIEIAGCVPVVTPANREGQIELEQLAAAITDRTRAIVTVSPSNPTGGVYPKETLCAVSQLCRERGIFHISDEAYEYFVYEGEHFSPGSLPDASDYTISLFSLSKAYGMAGWRAAYMVVPKSLELAVKKTQDTNLVCPPIVSQVAGAAALHAGRAWCDAQTRDFRGVRDLVIDELRSLGDRVSVPKPGGAFYAIVYVDTQRSDLELVKTLIQDFGVATLPGSTFGIQQCAIRVAYGALQRDTVAEGIGRLRRGLASLL